MQSNEKGDVILKVGLDSKNAEKDAKDLGDKVKKAVEGTGGQKSTRVMELENQLERASGRAESLRKKLSEIAESEKVPTQKYSDLEKQIQSLEAEFDKVLKLQDEMIELGFDDTGSNSTNQTFINITKQADELAEKLRIAEEEMEKLKASGEAYQAPETHSDRYERTAQDLEFAENKVDILKIKLEQLHRAETEAGKEGEKSASKIAGFFAKLESSGGKAGKAFSVVHRALSGVGKVLSGIKPVVGTVGKAALKAASAMGRMAKQMGKAAGNAVLNGFKKIGSAMFHIHRNGESAGLSFKRLLKYALGFQTLYTLFNRLRGALSDGLKTLVQVDSRTNKSISDLKTSLTTLKNSFASAFSPIINVVAPILTRFVNMLSDVVTRVGMFIAVLTGQKTYYRAVAVQENYAASLQDTADSAREAKKALDEYLSPLDELNKLDDPTKDSGSSGSSGGGGTAPGSYFEPVSLENSPLSDFAEKIKALIKGEDWEGLGALLASKINGLIDKAKEILDPESPQMKKLVKFSEAFAATFNSMVDHINWQGLGEALGYGINDLVNIAYPIVNKIDWRNLGSKFAEGANALIDTINWSKLGETIGGYFMILPKMAAGFVTTFDFGNFGTKLADGLAGLIKSMKLSTIAEAFVGIINGAFATIGSFSAQLEKNGGWTALKNNIVNGFNTMIEKIQPGEWARAISSFTVHIFDVLSKAIAGIKWDQLGSKIADFINNIDYGQLASKLLTLAGNIVNGLLEGIGSLLANTNWGDVVKSLLDGIWNWLKNFDWISFFKGLWSVIVGALKAAFQIVGAIAEWLFEVGKDIWNAICQGIGNLWEVIKAGCIGLAEGAAWLGKQIWDGIVNACKGLADWFVKWVINPIKRAFFVVMEGIGTGLDWAIGWTGLSWGKDLKNWARGALDELDAEASAYQWSQLSDDQKQQWTDQVTAAINDVFGIQVGVTGKDQVIKDLQDLQNKAGDFAKEYWAKLKESGGGKDGLTTKEIDDLSGKVGNFAKTYMATLKQQGADVTDKDIQKVATDAKNFAKKYLADIQQKNGKVTQKDIQACATAATKYKGNYTAYLKAQKDKKLNKNVDSAKSKVKQMPSSKSTFLKAVADNLKKNIDKAKGKVKELPNEKKVKVTSSTYTEVKNSLQSGFGNAWNKFVDQWTSRNNKTWAQKVIGSTLSLTKVYLAKGGIVSGATNAVIGEAGKEAVLPLERNTGWMKLLAAKLVSQMQGTLRLAVQGAVRAANSLTSRPQIVELKTASLDDSFTAFANRMMSGTDTMLSRMQAIVTGSVLPSNAQFLRAISGQSGGALSEDGLRQIVREELDGQSRDGKTTVIAQVQRKTLFELTLEEAKLRQQMTGRNPFELA